MPRKFRPRKPAHLKRKTGGARPGAGRPPGTGLHSRTSEQLREELRAKYGCPLEYMLKAMADPKSSKNRRDEMAKSAAPYMAAKLKEAALTGANGTPLNPPQLIITGVSPKSKR